MDSEDELFDEDLHDISQDVGEMVKEFTQRVHPLRVALAGVMAMIIIGSLVGSWYWVIPRDSVEINTKYIQRSGHIVLIELDNSGSRAITEVMFEVEFRDFENNLIGGYTNEFELVPSHFSIAGDPMELIVRGYTVWDNYSIVIKIDWTDFQGTKNSEVFTHDVGQFAYETFSDECETTTWFL